MRLPVKVHQRQMPKPTVPAKARPVNLVLHSPWRTRENSPQDLGYPLNPVNDDEGRGDHNSHKETCAVPLKIQKWNVLK